MWHKKFFELLELYKMSFWEISRQSNLVKRERINLISLSFFPNFALAGQDSVLSLLKILGHLQFVLWMIEYLSHCISPPLPSVRDS